ncbi:hypothetical protein BKA81DRAFT_58484 [Phyllosticta paracitricarpa]
MQSIFEMHHSRPSIFPTVPPWYPALPALARSLARLIPKRPSRKSRQNKHLWHPITPPRMHGHGHRSHHFRSSPLQTKASNPKLRCLEFTRSGDRHGRSSIFAPKKEKFKHIPGGQGQDDDDDNDHHHHHYHHEKESCYLSHHYACLPTYHCLSGAGALQS